MDHYQKHMKISELSAYSKMPLTTIRFYFREGLMPAPIKTSKSMAYYTKEHLDRLLKIRKMKKRNFSLCPCGERSERACLQPDNALYRKKEDDVTVGRLPGLIDGKGECFAMEKDKMMIIIALTHT